MLLKKKKLSCIIQA